MSKLQYILKRFKFNSLKTSTLYGRRFLGSVSSDKVNVSSDTLKKLEEAYSKFSQVKSKSLLKKHLTKDVFNALKKRQTSFKSTLLDCVQSGFANPDSNIGVYAPDAEAYTVFADLFDRIIEDYHNGFSKCSVQPNVDFGNVDCFKDLDPENKYIVSIRIRCGRSLHGFPFNPCLTQHQYTAIEENVTKALGNLTNELKGVYFPLCAMDDAFKKCLIDNHFLFKEGDRFLKAANASRYWPLGRGIYYNEGSSFLVWVNEEDHIRIISMQKGGDIHAVYARLVEGVKMISTLLQFSRHKRLGFLTFCPTNLGTTIRASVHIKVPKLSKDKAKFEEVAARYKLQIRGTSGEHSESIGGIYDISNKQRIGLTEFQAVKTMQDGILEMIKIEQSL